MHYLCDEANGWNPDLEDIESRITERTSARADQPEQPDRARCTRRTSSRAFVEIARSHDLVLLADEIYEKILYDGAEHVHAATLRPRHPVPDLQRAVQGVPGRRVPQRVGRGDRRPHRAADFLEGLTLLANMRMCANVPAQHAIQTALGGHQSINDLILPGGRLVRADVTSPRRCSRRSPA